MKKIAVIMAGGRGERFWPKSRNNLPKQFLSLTDDGKTMIQHTVERVLPIVEYEDIFVVTNGSYRQLVKEQIPDIPEENILCEPMAKNTAPAIGFVAAVISKKYGDAVMIILPSDHLIKSNEIFTDVISEAVEVAEQKENLVIIGITPSAPETGYGYINFVRDKEHRTYPGVYKVKKFVEKPSIDIAKEYVSSGKYLWNSGMFIWKASSILKNFEKHLPEMQQGLTDIKRAYATTQFEDKLKAAFEQFESISIDYGIMEKAEDIFILPGSFGWDDVGSWLALERIKKTDALGNVILGDVISLDTKNSIVVGGKKLIATVGIEDLVIVDTEDALFICHKDETQNVKKVVETLKNSNRNDVI